MKYLEVPPSAAARLSRPMRAGLVATATGRRAASRFTARRRLAQSRRLHLGAGDNLLPGWANLDALAMPGAISWDLRRRLPIADGQVDYVFSEHLLEHMSRQEGLRLLEECRRVLRPGGILRLSTPDLRRLIDAYESGSVGEWADMGWLPASPCQMINEGFRLWGHQFVYDSNELEAALRHVGFRDVCRVEHHSSEHDALRGLECRPDHGDLIVEALR